MKTARSFVRGNVIFQRPQIICLLAAVAMGLIVASPAQAYPPATPLPTYYGEDFLLPSLPGATGLVEVFPGDQTSQLPGMSAGDAASDPFANSSDLSGGGNPSDSSYGDTYNGTSTFSSYSGDSLSNGAGTAHYGISLGPDTSPSYSTEDPSSLYFADSSGNPVQQLPVLGVQSVPQQTFSSDVRFLIVQLQTNIPGGASGTQWVELPIYGQTPQVQFVAGDSPLSFSSASYFLSPTQIPLDDLNFNDLPPADPRFQPVPGISDGMSLGSQGSFTATLPEPGSVSMLLVGGAMCAAAGYRRWRKAS